MIGDDFCDLVQSIFEDPSRVRDINSTLMTLIPKKDVVSCMKDFLPISLCNVTYKTITKIIVQRLRGLMTRLVGPCHSSFVPNRQSGDNIVAAQEIFHSIRKKIGSIWWMAIKVDLEKAYDRLKWSIIRDTLNDIVLPEKMVELVWHCISTPKLQVLWNGKALDEFSPSRGICQGDPLSPYLFVLCIERLFQLISLPMDHKIWKHVQLFRDGPSISHLAFANDVIFFAKARLEQVQTIQTIFDIFCDNSGQKVSK